MKNREYYSKENRAGSNIHFGIREFAMTCIINAMALYGGIKPYGAGFFVFSDYAKSALRMAALMGAPAINVYTHDSIGVGEDGPTHQPIEQLAMLRSIPNFNVWRPCDTRETAAAWAAAVSETNTPSALILSRQDMPLLEGTGKDALKGAYILRGSEKVKPDIILMATGSEVALACEAFDALEAKGVKARVVSMPSWEVFEAQSDKYKEKVLPKSVTKRLAIEAASSFGWHKYTGFEGSIMSIDTYGECGKGALLFEHFGFTAENVIKKAEEILG
jgi:transketolase